ncbi:MAG: hypothetical protein GY791_13985 [Alphaproteobacteria bacterium]|nr:hypothetical protein [Alphaproteobacteria bacterium]
MKRLILTLVGGLAMVALTTSVAMAGPGCGGLKSAHTEKPAQTAGAPMTPVPTETKPQG